MVSSLCKYAIENTAKVEFWTEENSSNGQIDENGIYQEDSDSETKKEKSDQMMLQARSIASIYLSFTHLEVPSKDPVYDLLEELAINHMDEFNFMEINNIISQTHIYLKRHKNNGKILESLQKSLEYRIPKPSDSKYLSGILHAIAYNYKPTR